MNEIDIIKIVINSSENLSKEKRDECIEYINNLQQENEKYKKVIDKIDKKINDFIKCCKAEKIESGSDFLHHSYWNMFENFNKQIKEILKEVKKDCE